MDDAFIVYRYAANLAAGQGFAFNPGERVEGVSCFLWTLALVPAAWLGLGLPDASRWLTAAAGLALLALFPGTSARLRGAPRPDAGDWIAAGLVAVQPAFAYWSVGALETVPYALLWLLALRDGARERERGGLRSAGWAGLACLTRPEAPLLALALGLERLGWPRPRRAADALAWLSLVAAIFLPFLAFRWLYFGDWLPNTYYAKAGGGLAVTLAAGLGYGAAFLADWVPGFGARGAAPAALGALVAGALLVRGLALPRTRAPAALCSALALAVLLEGGDWMPLSRFFVPALPWLTWLAVDAGRSLARRRPGWRPALAALATLFAASQVARGLAERAEMIAHQAGYDRAHGAIAAELARRARPGDAVALMDVGRIGFETGLRVIDISGLTDRDVARAPGTFLDKHYPVAWILDREPRFVVLAEGFRIDARIARDPRFRREYRPVASRRSRLYPLVVFERVAPAASSRSKTQKTEPSSKRIGASR